MGIYISQTVETLLAEEVKRLYWKKWNDDNKEAVAVYNERVSNRGLSWAKYRTWGESLGNGQQHASAVVATRAALPGDDKGI